MAFDVYLNFSGNAREAVEFYAGVFGVEVSNMMTFGEAPPHPDYPLPEEAKNLIMHARLDIDGGAVMFTDVFPGSPFTVGNNVSLVVNGDSKEKMDTLFNKLKVGGNVTMELQETFWSKYYGMLTDKFGVQWMFNHIAES
ncbi:VOC family protein [Cohnella yongneupensis]|uniref:VOC family protein n=1 Tax=Cohnella yongneupensis TaxID=425006 RepID=A0ABW0R3M0_9BACL